MNHWALAIIVKGDTSKAILEDFKNRLYLYEKTK